MAQTIRIEIPIEVLDQTEKGIKSAEENLKKMKDQVKKTQEEIQRSQQRSTSIRTTQYDRTQEKAQKQLLKWAKQKYQVLLEAKDMVSPVASKISSGLRSFTSKAWKTTMKVVDYATKPIQGIIKLLKNPVFQVGAVLGISIGISDTIDTYKEFEAAMSKVKAISGATDDEFEQLNAKAIQVGADTKFSAAESAEALNYMAMAGWKTKDMLNGIDGIMDLAAASGENLGTTSDIVTDALTAFGLSAKDSTHFADVLAMASSNSNTNVAMMGETFKYVGPVAGAFGYTIEDTATAIGLMANAGIKASMAGTSLRRIMTELGGGATLVGKKFGKWHIETQKADGSMRAFGDVMKDLREAFAKMTEAEKVANAESIAGKTGMAGLLAIVNASAKDYDKLTEAIENADGASAKMAETMLDNLAGALEYMQGAVETSKLKLGERFSPYIIELAQWIDKSMPALDVALSDMMDWVDDKASELKERIKNMTESTQWQNADFFGKVQIAWDEIILEPFSEWWESSGRRKVADIMANFGHALGQGISMTLMGLLGINIESVTKEGESIGASFAKGFSDGFNLGGILKNLGGLGGGMVSSASKLLPGGESAGLSSLISAIILGKVIGRVGRGIGSFGSWSKSILLDTTVAGASGAGTAAGSVGAGVGETVTQLGLISLLKKGIGSFSLGSEATLAGTGIVPEAGAAATGSGLLGVLGKTGMVLGSGATTGAGMAAVGAGALTGAVIGGTTAISGVSDLYKSYKSDDLAEAEMYAQKGGTKVTGVAVGAMTGAAIGSFIPVIGTAAGALIGAGVGGLASKFKSEKIEEDYNEEQKKIQEAQLKDYKSKIFTGYSYEELQKIRIGSMDVRKALNSASYSAEEFGAIFQQAVNEDLVEHFGNVTLSLKEIKKVASQIVTNGNSKYLDNFNSAIENTESSLTTLQSGLQNLDKWNWRSSLGFELSDEDIESYKSAVDAVIESTKNYIEDKHYEVTAAVNLLVEDKEERKAVIEGLDKMYEEYGKQIDTLNKQLSKKMSDALSDGIISIDEEKEISKLQEQLQSFADAYAKAQEEAKFDTITIKFGNANLDYESFVSLQQEIQAQVQEATESYDSALELGITNLHLALDKGSINQKEFDEQVERLKNDYKANIDDLNVRVQGVQFDIVGKAFEDDLIGAGALADYTGTIGERLQQAVNDAISNGVDVINWDTETASRILGLDRLEVETQESIAQMVSSIVSQIPESIMKEMKSTETMSEIINNTSGKILDQAFGTDFRTSLGTTLERDLTEQIQSIAESTSSNIGGILDQAFSTGFRSNIGTTLGQNVGSGITNTDMEPINSAINTLKTNVGTSIDTSFSQGFNTRTKVNITADYNLINPTAKMTFSGSGINSSTVPIHGMIAEANANGSISSGKRLSWICEEGPEAIIPLVPGRRQRALELYEQTGKILGVEQHARGGITGQVNPFISENGFETNKFYDAMNSEDFKLEDSNVTTPIEVNVSVNPNMEIKIESSGNNEEKILATIYKNMGALADELGGELADKIGAIFKNMPVKS